MANEWFIPTPIDYTSKIQQTWTNDFKGRTLSEELGFSFDAAYGSNGWTRDFYDDFDGTAVGSQPTQLIAESGANSTYVPGTTKWFSYGRGPTGNGSPVNPNFPGTRPDYSVNQYQITESSVLGIGAVRVSGTTVNGVTYPEQFLGGHIQTQRRSPTATVPNAPNIWDDSVNMSYSQSYGYFEVKHMLEAYQGCWPGLWLISDDEYTTPYFPRIEIDIAELYSTSEVPGGDQSEKGKSHHVVWLHRSNMAAKMEPGWLQQDTGFSAYSAPGISSTSYEEDGVTRKSWCTGFHTHGMLMKPDATAPNGLGWMIFYADQIEVVRVPLIMEFLRHYYILLSNQQQDISATKGMRALTPYEQHWYRVDYVKCYRNSAWTDPDRLVYVAPPALTMPTKTFSLSRLERHLGAKWNIPINGSVPTFEHTSVATPPVMPPTLRFVIVQGATAGTVVGTVACTNVPTNPVRYRLVYRVGLGAVTDFIIDRNSGQITANATIDDISSYDLVVIASDYPITPVVQGNNCTRVLIDVRADEYFGFKYWRRGAVQQLRAWVDMSNTDGYALESTNQISKFIDLSIKENTWGQEDPTARALLVPNSLNGHPAAETQGSTVFYPADFEVITASAISNIVIRNTSGSGNVNSISFGSGLSAPSNSINYTDPMVIFAAWKADGALNPDPVLLSINGTDLTPASVTPANKAFTMAIAMVIKVDSAGGQNLGRLMNGSSLLSDNAASPGWFDGKLYELGILYWANNIGISTNEHYKLVGGLAWKWGLQDSLPVGHLYKSTAPKLWA